MENYLIMCFYAFSNVSGILYLTPKTYREQYDFITHKKESYFELLVIFKSWLHWIYSFLSCPSAKIPTLKMLTFVPFCITTQYPQVINSVALKVQKKRQIHTGQMILNKHESDSGSEQNIGSSCCFNVAHLFKFQALLWNVHYACQM